jgi:hypothetical protein
MEYCIVLTRNSGLLQELPYWAHGNIVAAQRLSNHTLFKGRQGYQEYEKLETNNFVKLWLKDHNQRLGLKNFKCSEWLDRPKIDSQCQKQISDTQPVKYFFMKDHCIEEEVDTVLTSLDAMKAFYSVSHQYTEEILKNNGLQFINCFKT